MHTPAILRKPSPIVWTKTGGFDIWTGDDRWTINRLAERQFRLSRHDGRTAFQPATTQTIYPSLAAAKAAADADINARHDATELSGAA